MNKAYRLIKNRHSGVVRVAPETAKAHGKSKTLKIGTGATAVRGVTCMVAALALLAAEPAVGGNYNWNVGTGDWSTAGNWLEGAVPPNSAATVAYIDNGGTAQITVSVPTVGGVRVGFGSGNTGTLEITSGGSVIANNNIVLIGYHSGSNGTVLIDGAGSSLDTGNFITTLIGAQGTGTLTLSNGGKITGAGLILGENGSSHGTLNIGNGGAAGIVNASSVEGKLGTVTLNFNHADADYFFTRDGMSTGSTVTILGASSTSVNLTGTGKTTFVGNNTYTGATTISAGTLQIGNGGTTGSIAGNITNNSALIFNRLNALTYAGVISGSGTLAKQGVGTLTLTDTNTYSGATTISGGILAVNGSLTNSAVTVNSGGTLGGSGTIGGAVTVNSGGTLAPGNSPGLLTVGSLTLDAGSTTVMEIDGTTRGTQYDAIDVTGTATLGGTLNLVFGYTPTVGDSYTLIDAAAINGDFSSIATTGLGAALKVVPTITDDYVMTVNFAQESFVATAGGIRALSGNQSGVAANLDTFSTSGQAADLIAALNTLSAGAFPSAFDQLSGASHAFAPTLAGYTVRQFHQVLGQRGRGIQDRGGASAAFNALKGVKLAYAGDDLASLVAGEKVAQDGFWVRALAADGRVDGDRNAAGADTSGAGLALGADRWLDANRLAGVALAYGTSRADSGGGNLDVGSFQLAAYGRWQGEAYYLDGSLGYGRHRTESRRDIAFLNQRARADYDTDSLSLNLEAGRSITHGRATLTPYAGIEGTMLHREKFAETGSAANLSVKGRTETAWRSRLGARYAWSDTRFQPTLDLAWVHAFGDAATNINARFAAAPAASTFRVAGPELDRNRLALGLGLTAWTGKNARLDLAYNGEFAGSDREQQVSATFRWVW